MLERYQACFLGLALGDASCARFEGGLIERLMWQLIGKTFHSKMRYTDDTQMSIDLACSILSKQHLDQDDIANTFANSYRWSRGYGPAAATILKKIRRGRDWRIVNRQKFPEGSFGNGAAMRSPILALVFPYDPQQLATAVSRCSEITHTHHLAIGGAQLIAEAVRLSLDEISPTAIIERLLEMDVSPVYLQKLHIVGEYLDSKSAMEISAVKQTLGNDIAATDSCITAIYFGLRYNDASFVEMLRDIGSMRGDADTIGAMAGAIWGARHGMKKLHHPLLAKLEDLEFIRELATTLFHIKNKITL